MTFDPFDPFDPRNPYAMFHDFFLKFSDEGTADAVLFEGEDEGKRAKYLAVDVIGTIYKPTGEMLLGEDGEYPAMAPVPGWHANVRHTGEAPELDKYTMIQVDTPVRMWA